MTSEDRLLDMQTVAGEIGLVINYQAGKTPAVDVLQGAMDMIYALDKLDATLLSSVDTSLEPISILNDVQHSSLKLLLARTLRHVPDELISNPDWKKWVGWLLVKGKHALLEKLDSDAPEIQRELDKLEYEYKNPPGHLVGYQPPKVADVIEALEDVSQARARLSGQSVTVQTELGDVLLPEVVISTPQDSHALIKQEIINTGTEFFKVKSPDMLGSAQWTVLRNNRNVKVDMLHRGWIEAYHRREHIILPGDSLKCKFEESICYDENGNEIDRKLAIIEVLEVISPPIQNHLII